MAEITKDQVKKAILEGLERIYECTRIQGKLSENQKKFADEVIDILFTTPLQRATQKMENTVKEAKKNSIDGKLVCPTCEKVCSTTSGLILHLKRHATI